MSIYYKKIDKDEKSSNYGISFTRLLGVLFIGLKLTGAITWPWMLVLMPLWILPFLGILILLLYNILSIKR